MASKSALFAQIQANMRAAARRALEKEDEISMLEPDPVPEAPEEPPKEEPVRKELPVVQFTPQRIAVPQVLSEAERRVHSLAPVAVELVKVLIKAKGFINLAHVDINGPRGKVPYETIRSAVKRLGKEGFFDYKGVGNYGTLKGMTYSLNKEILNTFLSIHGEQPVEQMSSLQIKQEDQVTKHTALDHPELKAWRDFGLSEKQIKAWQAEFSLDDMLMEQYLKWCAFDIEHNHADNPVKNMANWFYVMLRNTGSYPKPDGYVSLEDRRLQQLEQLKAEQADRKQREVQAMQDSIDSSLKEYFEQVMSEGEANELYAELRASLNDFSRRLEKVPGNPVFRAAMWAAFKTKAGL